MRLRTFTASDMPSAIKLVRAEMGAHAIILSSEKLKNGKGISVTAALEPNERMDDSPVPPRATAAAHASCETLRHEIQGILRFHNVPEPIIGKMLRKTTDRELASFQALDRLSGGKSEAQLLQLAMEKLLSNFFDFTPLAFDGHSTRIMLFGPPGIGKTLTIAKMAARMALDKQPVAVITTDTTRAGGVEQLQAFTDILELPLHVASGAKELKKHLDTLPKHAQILVDTAGCNPFSRGEVGDLAALAGVGDVEPILVLPAGGDSMEAVDIIENFEALPARRLLITRSDTARRFGSIIAAGSGLAFCNVSTSPGIADPLHAITPQLLAQLLLRYK